MKTTQIPTPTEKRTHPSPGGTTKLEPHVFSESYTQRKQALLSEVEGSGVAAKLRAMGGRADWRIAAAVTAIFIALPVTANAVVSHTDLFNKVFGTGFRESVEPLQMEVESDSSTEDTLTVTLPAKDYVDIDPEEADALLGQYVTDESVTVKSADGHVLTISNAIRSDYALVYRFTLEREEGVNALTWNEVTNRTKGAEPGPDALMVWFVAGDEFRYIDPDESTDERLVGYAYSALGEDFGMGQQPEVTLTEYSEPINSDEDAEVTENTLTIPCAGPVPSVTLTNADGGTIELSPLGLALDNETGLYVAQDTPFGSEVTMSDDPYYTRKVQLNYADGTSYTVYDDDGDLDNTSSLCGFDNSSHPTISMVFNRLVDPARVESIEVSVADVPSGDPNDLWDENGNEPNPFPTKTVTYTPQSS